MLTKKISRKLSTGKHLFGYKFTQSLRSLQPSTAIINGTAASFLSVSTYRISRYFTALLTHKIG